MLVYSSDVIGDYNGVLLYLDLMKAKYEKHSISFTHDLRLNKKGYKVLLKLKNV